jgi:hypothetical protein
VRALGTCIAVIGVLGGLAWVGTGHLVHECVTKGYRHGWGCYTFLAQMHGLAGVVAVIAVVSGVGFIVAGGLRT